MILIQRLGSKQERQNSDITAFEPSVKRKKISNEYKSQNINSPNDYIKKEKLSFSRTFQTDDSKKCVFDKHSEVPSEVIKQKVPSKEVEKVSSTSTVSVGKWPPINCDVVLYVGTNPDQLNVC